LRDLSVALFQAAIAAVEPALLVVRHIRRRDEITEIGPAEAPVASWSGPTLVVGAGKAAAGMAQACEAALGDGARGEVITATGCGRSLQHILVSEAGHPLPDERGHQAALRLLDAVGAARDGGILCLVSGGASSLTGCPRPPLTLADKVATTNALLACGADIRELNTVRKHLSLFKGGGLLARARRRLVTLIISDVVGDDPAVIGSGPTVADPSNFAEALAVLSKYELSKQVPRAVLTLLQEGVAGRLTETLKPNDPRVEMGRNIVIASSSTALAAAAEAAHGRGWKVLVESEPIVGSTKEAAEAFAARLLRQARSAENVCVLAGGETTVHVRGTGQGGRNQEFALALAGALEGRPGLILSAGTDGIDGPTPAAGAFVDGTTVARARARLLDPVDFLERNDSYTFFRCLGDDFTSGPTGTNVMDIKIALLPACV